MGRRAGVVLSRGAGKGRASQMWWDPKLLQVGGSSSSRNTYRTVKKTLVLQGNIYVNEEKIRSYLLTQQFARNVCIEMLPNYKPLSPSPPSTTSSGSQHAQGLGRSMGPATSAH